MAFRVVARPVRVREVLTGSDGSGNHSPSLRATALLAPPDEADLEPARLPGLRYPSDHLAIMAEFVG